MGRAAPAKPTSEHLIDSFTEISYDVARFNAYAGGVVVALFPWPNFSRQDVTSYGAEAHTEDGVSRVAADARRIRHLACRDAAGRDPACCGPASGQDARRPDP